MLDMTFKTHMLSPGKPAGKSTKVATAYMWSSVKST